MAADWSSNTPWRVSADALANALIEWQNAIGMASVLVDRDTLNRFSRTTSASSRRPVAVLTPESTAQVQTSIMTARRHRIPLYPISTGQNWGYGDACAVFDGQVILDLSRMNKIEKVDAALGFAVVEPGVTQRQLAEHLSERDIPFWIDCTGAGPNSSLIGNIVERGFGHTPYGNRFQNMSGMEVVLGTGQVLHTGFGHYPSAETTHLYPYGIGPYLDGLFTQSSFGVVTKLGVWLLPIPELCCPFLVLFENDSDLFLSLDALRTLRMQGVLQSVSHIGNDLRALASAHTFPVRQVPSGARLPSSVRMAMRKDAGIGAWSMSGAFYGSRKEVAMRKRALRSALRGVCARTLFLEPLTLRFGRAVARWCDKFHVRTGLGPKLKAAEALAGMHCGKPTGFFLRGSYWRKRGGWPDDIGDETDLARDSVGIKWLAPIVPFDSNSLKRLIAAMDPLFAEHGFDCHVTVNMINSRALAAVLTVEFDAEDKAETGRAEACFSDALAKAFSLGYPPYRASIAMMNRLAQDTNDTFWALEQRLKGVLDPDGILAPGRYGPYSSAFDEAPQE